MGFRNPITTAADPTARMIAAAAQAAANQAQSTANSAQTAAQTAQTAANQAITSADTAQASANSALTVAQGKNTTYVSGSQPTAPSGGFTAGDTWINTAQGNAIYTWQASTWTLQALGSGALAANSVTATQLAANAVVAGSIAAGALDAKTITGSTIRTAAAGQRVQLDSTNGLIGYNSAGAAVTQIRPSDGTLIAAGAQITGTLDTGANSTSPGVKVYNVAGSPATGAVEWRTGTMDPGGNAYAKLTGGGSGGSAFYLQGGQTELTTAPTLALNVESLPGGGYGPVMRLKAGAGGQIIQDVATSDLIPLTSFPTSAYPNYPTYFAPWGSTYDDAYYELDADGYVNLGGIVKCVTAGTWPAAATIVQLPAGCRPGKPRLVDALVQQSAYGRMVLQVDTAGNVKHIGAEPGWSYVAGAPLILDGIRFRAVQ